MTEQPASRLIGIGHATEVHAVHIRDAVVPGQAFVDEGVLRPQHVDKGTILSKLVFEKQLRLLPHRVTQAFVKRGVGGRVRCRVPELAQLQPLAGEVLDECAHSGTGEHEANLLVQYLRVSNLSPGRDVKELIVEVRRLRKEYGVGESERITIHVVGGSEGFGETVTGQAAAFDQLARVSRIEGASGAGLGAHAVLSNGAELFVPLEGVIDIQRERGRIHDEITRVEGLLATTRKMLENEKFVGNAPPEVVGKERDKAVQFAEQSSKLREKLTVLGE